MTAPTLRLLSLGAGVQSTTLALMTTNGDLPKVDGAIFADTGWEPRRVYDVLDQLETVLTKAGIPLYRVRSGNLREDAIDPSHRYASIPYFVLNHVQSHEPIKSSGVECRDCQGTGWLGGGLRDGYTAPQWLEEFSEEQREDLELAATERGCAGCDAGNMASGASPDKPPHTCYSACPTCGRPGGTPGVVYREWYPVVKRQEGMGRRQCTSEYKLAPIGRKVRELLGAEPPNFRRVPKGRLAEQWIGFSTDEMDRVNPVKDAEATDGTTPAGGKRKRARGVSYLTSRYPLIELGMSRTDCEAYLAEHGWGHVAKSACIGCPFHGNKQWRDLRDNHPGEWADAVEFDVAIRKGGSRGLPGNGEAFLHRSMLPLSVAPIDLTTRAERAEWQIDLFDLAEEGDPDACSPYGCRSGAPTEEGTAA